MPYFPYPRLPFHPTGPCFSFVPFRPILLLVVEVLLPARPSALVRDPLGLLCGLSEEGNDWLKGPPNILWHRIRSTVIILAGHLYTQPHSLHHLRE